MAVPSPRGGAEAEPQTVEGYRHEMGVYRSDDEFGELICPFALDGLAADEPVIFAYDSYKMELLQRWLPDSERITYVTDTGPYATPTKALVQWRKLVEERLAHGAVRVRVAGNVPHPGYGRPYVGWDRYEAAVDRAMGDLPLWASCLYDARITPPEVLSVAEQRHHHVLERTGAYRVNESFAPALRFADFLCPPPDPLERVDPALELIDPTPAGVRAAVAQLAVGIISAQARDELVLAASEAVANALVHGKPPVRVRAWRGQDRVVVHVHDEGAGPTDPLVGMLRLEREEGGRGLWLVHQLDIEVVLLDSEGFTVSLRAHVS